MLFASCPKGLFLHQEYICEKLLQRVPKRWAERGWMCLLGQTCTAVAGSWVHCPQKGQTGFTIGVLLTLGPQKIFFGHVYMIDRQSEVA